MTWEHPVCLDRLNYLCLDRLNYLCLDGHNYLCLDRLNYFCLDRHNLHVLGNACMYACMFACVPTYCTVIQLVLYTIYNYYAGASPSPAGSPTRRKVPLALEAFFPKGSIPSGTFLI